MSPRLVVTCLVVTMLHGATARADDEEVVPSAPSSAAYAAEVPCPPGLEVHRGRCMERGSQYAWGPDWIAVASGLAILGGVYALQVLSTAISTAQGQNDVRTLGYPAARLAEYETWGYVPLLGPWAKIVLAPPHVDDAGATLFVIEGLLELGGLTMAVVSLFTHQEETWREPGAVTVRVTPTPGGATVFGTF